MNSHSGRWKSGCTVHIAITGILLRSFSLLSIISCISLLMNTSDISMIPSSSGERSRSYIWFSLQSVSECSTGLYIFEITATSYPVFCASSIIPSSISRCYISDTWAAATPITGRILCFIFVFLLKTCNFFLIIHHFL